MLPRVRRRPLACLAFLTVAAGTCLAAPAAAVSLQGALAAAYQSNPQLMAARARLRATDEGVALAGLGALAIGALLKASSSADTRVWEMTPRTAFVIPLRLAPLYSDTRSNWSRRAYFKHALAAPGRVAMMGPHYSLADGQDCYTAALAFEHDGTHVLCVDFVPTTATPDLRPVAGRGGKR